MGRNTKGCFLKLGVHHSGKAIIWGSWRREFHMAGQHMSTPKDNEIFEPENRNLSAFGSIFGECLRVHTQSFSQFCQGK